MTKRKKIEVTWVDSHTRSGWDSVKSAQEAIEQIDHTCLSVGYKFQEDDEFLWLVMTLGEPELIHTLHSIPKAAILKVRKLK